MEYLEFELPIKELEDQLQKCQIKAKIVFNAYNFNFVHLMVISRIVQMLITMNVILSKLKRF